MPAVKFVVGVDDVGTIFDTEETFFVVVDPAHAW